jgi:hypothetical protein
LHGVLLVGKKGKNLCCFRRSAWRTHPDNDEQAGGDAGASKQHRVCHALHERRRAAAGIRPDAMPASCPLTERSIELVMDGTAMALPTPTSISAPPSHHPAVCVFTRASAR